MNARKISFIDFPFIHSQMSAIFTFIILQVVPLMVLSYVKQKPMLGAIINFFTVLCFCGQHEGKLTLQIEVYPYRFFMTMLLSKLLGNWKILLQMNLTIFRLVSINCNAYTFLAQYIYLLGFLIQ